LNLRISMILLLFCLSCFRISPLSRDELMFSHSIYIYYYLNKNSSAIAHMDAADNSSVSTIVATIMSDKNTLYIYMRFKRH
jgi:hypothetical protein